MTTLLVIVAFVIINLCITVLLRYLSANDGWLDYYRRTGGKVVDKGR